MSSALSQDTEQAAPPTGTARQSASDRGTQELKGLALVIVDRLKRLKQVESCHSRNWQA